MFNKYILLTSVKKSLYVPGNYKNYTYQVTVGHRHDTYYNNYYMGFTGGDSHYDSIGYITPNDYLGCPFNPSAYYTGSFYTRYADANHTKVKSNLISTTWGNADSRLNDIVQVRIYREDRDIVWVSGKPTVSDNSEDSQVELFTSLATDIPLFIPEDVNKIITFLVSVDV